MEERPLDVLKSVKITVIIKKRLVFKQHNKLLILLELIKNISGIILTNNGDKKFSNI